jgi:hypothetical protein
MYKPRFLGISNADPLVLSGFLIALMVSLIVIACLIFYFAGYYLIKLIRWIRKNSLYKTNYTFKSNEGGVTDQIKL